MVLSKLAQVAAFLTYVLKMSVSNLGQDTGYPGSGFPSGEGWDSTLE
jgi:hypothetical protein